ncbi:hypothetical protein GJ496_005922 [Pomphorhynchus laevis]|nr:hypothetical protein GJ496_005922 [Pomphorhynchus laevis]
MDFRLLNSYISSHTADSDVCISKLRNWRRWGDRLSLIDLRRAYLQIHVDESLWPYQVVIYRNKRYVLTRLGFRLNIAPRILKAIVHFVLSKDLLVAQSTDSYLDDIIVDNTKIANDNVLKLLAKFGLEAKQPVDIQIKSKMSMEDPARGRWAVPPGDTGSVWADASSIAEGVVIEVDGIIAEDASWLRPKDDPHHINMAELNACIRGLNLSIHWNLKNITLYTDSATVYSWICSTLYDERNVCVKGLSDMLIKRRLQMLKEIQTEFSLSITVKLIPSSQNKADHLTRVPKNWLQYLKNNSSANIAVSVDMSTQDTNKIIELVHNRHHFGVERTIYFINRKYPNSVIYKYKSKLPWERIENRESSSSVSEFSTGDQVFMRPAVCRCDKPWIQGNVTGINSNTSINVDGVPHHISHLRRCPSDNNTPTASSTG